MEEKKFKIQEINKSISSLTNFQNLKKKFVITKKIAKHGKQSIIVIPKILEDKLKPGTLAEISINIIDNSNKENLEGEEKIKNYFIK